MFDWLDPDLAWLPFFRWMEAHARLLYAAAAGAMGLMVGSFLNVAIYRWPRELNLLRPASACPACGHPIRARDNMPVLGWLLLRGRCRDCGAPISVRYPLVEALHGALWALAAWCGWGWNLPYAPAVNAGVMLGFLAFISLLTAATFIDFDVQMIPDGVSVGGGLFMLAASVVWPALHVKGRPPADWWFPVMGPRFEAASRSLAGMALGAGIVLAVTLAGTLAFRRRLKELQKENPEIDTAVGFGDVKLMLLIGGYLGPRLVPWALLLSVYAGGIVGVALKWATGRWPEGEPRWTLSSMGARWRGGAALMALGPYLAIGGLVMAFGGDALADAIWHWVFPPLDDPPIYALSW